MFSDEDIWGHTLFMLEYVSISGSEYEKNEICSWRGTKDFV